MLGLGTVQPSRILHRKVDASTICAGRKVVSVMVASHWDGIRTQDWLALGSLAMSAASVS